MMSVPYGCAWESVAIASAAIASNAALGIGKSGGWLAEVVAEAAQTDHQIFPGLTDPLCGKGVHDVQGVDPHVPFRMPFRILLAADQRGQLRGVIDPAAVA